jgi:hypothetical protein
MVGTKALTGGTKALTGGTKALTGGGLMVAVRHGLLEAAMRRLDELSATSPTRLFDTTGTERAWRDHAEPDRTIRDPGATPLRGLRLT